MVKISKKLNDLIMGLNATPFLFIGSGLTRRYYNLPDWKNLLTIFAKKIKDDEFTYPSYENRAKAENPKLSGASVYPEVATLIENDFNEKWFSDSSIRSKEVTGLVLEGVSAFKAEIANYIQNSATHMPEYKNEIIKFQNMTIKNISGIITTNYDCFLESMAQDYITYIGQEELVFSPTQGIAEIYKIHGCITKPESIIVNKTDYEEFENKSAYLAAKLLTIFMENPIIFLGYSISDINIRNIIKSIVHCLSSKNMKRLENRFIFVEYDRNRTDVHISSYTEYFDEKMIGMTKIELSDFSLLYDALASIKSSIPVRLLRKYKQEFYDYALTKQPSPMLRVATIDDNRIEDEEIAIAIGKMTDLNLFGLTGIDTNDWYRNIIINDLPYSADDLLKHACHRFLKTDDKLPLYKYLRNAEMAHKDIEKIISNQTFDDLINNSIKKNRNTLAKIQHCRSVQKIWNNLDFDLKQKTRFLAYLNENEINIADLEKILNSLFLENRDILKTAEAEERTNLRRLIRIYDYLKYKKPPPDNK